MNNLNLILIAFDFLKEVSAILSNELSGLINLGRVRLVDHTIYVRKNIKAASSNFDLIDEETSKIEGISSIKGTRLEKNQAVIFSQIALGYATDAAAGQEGAVNYGAAAPAELRNANFVISQNGREVVSIPVADLLRPEGTDLNSSDQYYKLGGFAYLVDDESMDWQLRFPPGVSIPNDASFYYLEVFIKGFKTIKNVR